MTSKLNRDLQENEETVLTTCDDYDAVCSEEISQHSHVSLLRSSLKNRSTISSSIVPQPLKFCASKISASSSSSGYSNQGKRVPPYKKLKENLKKIRGPPWFKELSKPQMKAADSLHASLQDDLEQHSQKKTRRSISDLGVNPIPKSENLKIPIEMSRGNDLAFLWFFNEIFYNRDTFHEQRTHYSMNEKILLSSIVHLDMVTTLRELHRRIPKPAVPKKAKPIRKAPKPKKVYESPYLEPLTRAEIPEQKMYSPRNKPGPKPKEVYESPYLKPIPRAEIPEQKLYLPPNKPSISLGPYEVYKDPDYTPPNETNRWYAKKEQKSSKEIDREALLKEICSGSAANFEQRKEEIFDNFMELTKCKRRKNARIIYQVDLDNAESPEEFKDLAEVYQNQIIVRTIVRDLLENAFKVQKLRACCKTLDCMVDYERYLCLFEKNMEQQRLARAQQRIKFFDIKECKFDYDKIFNDETFEEKQLESGYLANEIDNRKYNESTEICMKNLFCLEVPLWTQPPDAITKSKTEDDYGESDDCSTEIEEDNSWEEKYDKQKPEAREQQPKEERDQKMKKKKDVEVEYKDEDEIPTITDYTGETLMELLQESLKVMKKNPKYVLASLPIVHELPMLVKWLFKRFNRRFSDKERLKHLKAREQDWELMKKQKCKIKPPKPKDISPLKEVTYDQHDWLVRETNAVLEPYYHNVKKYFFDQGQLFWPMLRTYFCTDGLPLDVFYAYLPASENDVYPFRPWK